MNKKAIASVANSVRALSMDMIQKAKSGHPGLPMGCAELGAVIFGEVLKHNPKDSKWIDRDRFVLSAGHGSALLYSLLHLCGYGVSLDDIKNFFLLISRKFRKSDTVTVIIGIITILIYDNIILSNSGMSDNNLILSPVFGHINHYW